MKLIKRLISSMIAQHRYFIKGKDEIARENLTTMTIVGFVGAAVALIFFVIAPIIIDGWSVTIEYIYILPILLLSALFSYFYSRRDRKARGIPGHRINANIVTVAGVLFYLLILADMTALSIFPYPNTPQIFISLCFMFMPVLLILHPLLLLGIMLLSETVYIILAYEYKTQFAIENDIFNTIAALFFSVIIMSITNHLRTRNYDTRMTLQKIGETDALTGLMNKMAYEEYCENYLRIIEPGKHCALLVLDLDNFKQVNDVYGHPFGDDLLEAVGKILLHAFRQSDFVGRIGGDEFSVLMCGFEDAKFLTDKCNNICRNLSELKINDEIFNVKCSVGITISPDLPTTYQEMFRLADDALYRVKREKKSIAPPERPMNWCIADGI